MLYLIMCTLKILTGLCLIKLRIKTKNTFVKVACSVLVVRKVLIQHKEHCLIINGKQNVKLKKGFISFKNYSRQIPVPFKIYADFECILKNVDNDIINNDISYTRKYQELIPCSFAYNVVCIDNKFSKTIVLYRGKRLKKVNVFIKSILNEYNYCKK